MRALPSVRAWAIRSRVPQPRVSLILLLSTGLVAGAILHTSCTRNEVSLTPIQPLLDTLFVVGETGEAGDPIIARALIGPPPSLDLGPDNLLWVFNPAPAHLEVFDAHGHLVATHGRGGNGPGEFSMMDALTALDGGAWTWDSSNQQLCKWSPQKGLVQLTRTALPDPGHGRVSIETDGILWYLHTRMDEASAEEAPIELNILRPDGSGESIYRTVVPGVFVMHAYMWSYLPVLSRATTRGVVMSPDYEYRLIHATDSGGPPVQWQFASTNTPYPEAQRQRGGRGAIVLPSGERLEAPLMPHQPDVEEIHRVNEQELWIRTPVRKDTTLARYDRLDASGNRIGAWWLPRSWSDIRLVGDRLYTLSYSREEGYRLLGLRIRNP